MSEKDNIIIFDSVADQRTVGVPAWDIAYHADKSVNWHNYLKDDKEPVVHDLFDLKHVTIFQSILGACQWACTSGRIDATFALASLSRFMVSPRENNLIASVKILGYLKNI